MSISSLDRPIRVLTVLFPEFELLDVAGPLEILGVVGRVLRDKEASIEQRGNHLYAGSNCPGYVLRTCVLDASHLVSGSSTILATDGVKLAADVVVDENLSKVEEFDILMIPGGLGVRTLCNDAIFFKRLEALAKRARLRVITVCTGSALLAKTGLLDGKRATSNKRAWKWISTELNCPLVKWTPNPRWCIDANFWASSGVAAGTDMAAAMVQVDFGANVADAVVKRIEYVWQREADEDVGGFARAWGAL